MLNYGVKCRKNIFGGFSMSKKIGLVVYRLSVLDKNSKRVSLKNFFEENSFLDVIQCYVKENMEEYTMDTSKETLFIFDKIGKRVIENENNQEEFELLYGRVKTGEYGIESELVNITNGEVYSRKKEQADMMPFGFCIAVAKGEVNTAVILFQTIGALGMKISLQRHLQRCVSKVNKDYILSIKAIAPSAYIDKYFKYGILQKIRLIRYEIPEDISNRMGINYGVKDTKEERIIHKPLGFIETNKHKFMEWRNGQRSFTKIVEIDGFEYDDFKLEFKLGRSNKTFSLGDIDKVVVNEDITSEVSQSGGHPIFKSLVSIMKRISREYLIDMGFLIE